MIKINNFAMGLWESIFLNINEQQNNELMKEIKKQTSYENIFLLSENFAYLVFIAQFFKHKKVEKVNIESFFSSSKDSSREFMHFIHFPSEEKYPKIEIGEISNKDYLLTFTDLKNSTNKIKEQKWEYIKEIFDFFLKAVIEYKKSIHKNFKFKLVGDGILFLTPYPSSEEISSYQEYINKFFFRLKEKTLLDFRIVAGIGTLECAPIYINGEEILEECIGFALSKIVKESKKVDTFKWLGYIQ